MPLHELTLIDKAGFERTSDNVLELITGTGTDPRPRLRVDVAQTGFWEGRIFRSFYDAALPAGQTAVMRFTADRDFLLHEQTFNIAVGYCKFTAVLGGTPGGVFTDIPQIGVNRMANRPSPEYTPGCVLAVGGTHTGGTTVEAAYLKTVGNSQQASTITSSLTSERGLPAGVYYLKVANLGNDTAVGVYNLVWEEYAPMSPLIY